MQVSELLARSLDIQKIILHNVFLLYNMSQTICLCKYSYTILESWKHCNNKDCSKYRPVVCIYCGNSNLLCDIYPNFHKKDCIHYTPILYTKDWIPKKDLPLEIFTMDMMNRVANDMIEQNEHYIPVEPNPFSPRNVCLNESKLSTKTT
jgi:hypothetical protein